MISFKLDLIARPYCLNIEGIVLYHKLACLLVVGKYLNVDRLNNLLTLYYKNEISTPFQFLARLKRV